MLPLVNGLALNLNATPTPSARAPKIIQPHIPPFLGLSIFSFLIGACSSDFSGLISVISFSSSLAETV